MLLHSKILIESSRIWLGQAEETRGGGGLPCRQTVIGGRREIVGRCVKVGQRRGDDKMDLLFHVVRPAIIG